MFKIGKIKQISNEKVIIKPSSFEKGSFKDGKATYSTVKNLCFEIKGDDYSFSFELSKSIDDLLNIPMSEKIDFKDYLFHGETFFTVKGEESYMDPEMDIEIYRYLENSFEITIHFISEGLNAKEEYSGYIQFDFDLNNFLDK